jgi:hypothetical protein
VLVIRFKIPSFSITWLFRQEFFPTTPGMMLPKILLFPQTPSRTGLLKVYTARAMNYSDSIVFHASRCTYFIGGTSCENWTKPAIWMPRHSPSAEVFYSEFGFFFRPNALGKGKLGYPLESQRSLQFP